jgi:hypothetical protein
MLAPIALVPLDDELSLEIDHADALIDLIKSLTESPL